MACRKGAGQLFKDLKLVDEVIEVDKTDSKSGRDFSRAVRKESYQVVLCPHESFRTAWLMRRIRAVKKVGFEQWWNGFAFNVRLMRPMHWPEALRQLSLLRALNISVADQFERSVGSNFLNSQVPRNMVKKWADRIPKFAQLYVAPDATVVAAAKAKLGIQLPAVFVAPGSVWATKMWKEKHYIEIVKKLSARKLNVYLTGSSAEAELCERIAVAAESAVSGPAARVTGTLDSSESSRDSSAEIRSIAGQTSLTEMHALMTLSKFIISNDSSPIHLAAMAGVPSIAIFGPTTLNLGYRPWDDRSKVAQVDLPCRPCGKHGHMVCPLGTHACMEDVTVAQVESLIRDLEV